MKKGKRRIVSFVLVAALLLGILPGDTVLAGTDEVDAYRDAVSVYETATGAFWNAIDAYCGTWDEQGTLIIPGAYDQYVQAVESGAENVSALYTEAESARNACTSSYSDLESAYGSLESAYGALTAEEQANDAYDYHAYTEDYLNAGENINNLPELCAPTVYVFYRTMDDYDAIAENYWSAIKAYCGESSESVITPGVYDTYIEAKDSGAENVQEFYEVAVVARQVCVDAFVELETAYRTVMTAYDALDDMSKAIQEVADRKANLEESFADASDTNTNLAVVPVPEEEPQGQGEYTTVYIDVNGNFDGNTDASVYWKVNEIGKLTEATAEDYSLKIEKMTSGVKLTLRDFQFTSVPEGTEGDAVWSEVPLTLVLEGTNSITGTKGIALGVAGSLTINGSGSLSLNSTSGEIMADDGTTYIPMALQVQGGLTNTAVVTCNSNNAECTVSLACTSKDIANTGAVTVGAGQKIRTDDGPCAKLVRPTNQYNSSADYPVPTDHVYVAKAYYYEAEVSYPNDMYDFGDDTSQWKTVGRYDENGKPLGSNVWYQYWYVDSRGGMLTEDIVNPTKYLVYEDNPESLIRDKDIVSVTDGRNHTFNADLYALWFTKGNVTVNGNVIMDIACANVAKREASGSDDYLNYVWNNGSRVWMVESTVDSNVTVNGNVGLVSLNDSYIGNVTVNGNIDLLGFYEDMDPSVVNTLSFVPESFYGSKANAGTVIRNGEFVGIGAALQGYQGYSVYNTEDFYSMTERVLQGETVHGTTAAIEGDSLLIDVTKSVIGETTYPCVKAVDESKEEQIRNVLTNEESKLVVMDISLIQDNARTVEPQTTVKLYIDNLSGFSKPAVYHVKDNGEIEKLFVYDGNEGFGGSVTCATNSFSTYFIAEDQTLRSNELDSSQNENTVTVVAQINDNPLNVTTTLISPQTGDTSAATTTCVMFFAGIAVLAMIVMGRR